MIVREQVKSHSGLTQVIHALNAPRPRAALAQHRQQKRRKDGDDSDDDQQFDEGKSASAFPDRQVIHNS
jgi:hypothetical protein